MTATYQQVIGSGSGNLRTAISQVGLPLAFFVRVEQVIAASKDSSDFKLNLIMNRTVPSVTALFEDAIEQLQAREAC